MNELKRAEKIFDEAKELGMINSVTGEGMPTVAMVHEVICDMAYNHEQTQGELAAARGVIHAVVDALQEADVTDFEDRPIGRHNFLQGVRKILSHNSEIKRT